MQQAFIKIALDNWYTQISRASKLIDSLTDEQLAQETAPGRNTGTYLLGHLVAVHDSMIPLLNVGSKMYPQLEEPFIKQPDKSELEKPSIQQLRSYWTEMNNALTLSFNLMNMDEWFQKHTAVSEEDFAVNPSRNKLNVLLTRTNHLAYHLGQLVYLKQG
jgi:hypothetical protein